MTAILMLNDNPIYLIKRLRVESVKKLTSICDEKMRGVMSYAPAFSDELCEVVFMSYLESVPINIEKLPLAPCKSKIMACI
jgi:hypothetical protein